MAMPRKGIRDRDAADPALHLHAQNVSSPLRPAIGCTVLGSLYTPPSPRLSCAQSMFMRVRGNKVKSADFALAAFPLLRFLCILCFGLYSWSARVDHGPDAGLIRTQVIDHECSPTSILLNLCPQCHVCSIPIL